MVPATNPTPGAAVANDTGPASTSRPPAYVLDFAAAQKLRDTGRDHAQGRPSVLIYQPCRNVNQRGARPRCWVLEFTPTRPAKADALMGWMGQGDLRQPVRLTFPTKAHATAFARRQGWDVMFAEPPQGPARIYELEAHRPVAPSLAGLGQWHAVL